jgi:L-methionine (R)-S-oxide reductase
MVGTARCAVRVPICNGEWPFADAAARRPYQFFRHLRRRLDIIPALHHPENTCRPSDDVKHKSMPSSGNPDGILGRVTDKLQQGGERAVQLGSILDDLLQHFQCSAGTIHLLAESGFLELTAQRGLPEFVVAKITTIPVGKGMAGIAAERREPVQVCNLQTDTSGVVRPGARDTKMEGSVAAPMIGTDGALKGTLGVAKPVPYDFTPDECDLLMKVGAQIAAHVP